MFCLQFGLIMVHLVGKLSLGGNNYCIFRVWFAEDFVVRFLQSKQWTGLFALKI